MRNVLLNASYVSIPSLICYLIDDTLFNLYLDMLLHHSFMISMFLIPYTQTVNSLFLGYYLIYFMSY